MKKIALLVTVLVTIIACEKSTTSNEFKTAYIDTAKLMEESTEGKDIQEKYKEKAKVMGSKLEAEVSRWRNEAQNFQKNAMANGQAWAQQKGAELQKREQELTYAQDAMLRQLQQESGTEMDSLVKSYRDVIKKYGKEKGYDYIYGTGDSYNVLYAKDSYDITKDIIKIINDKYKASDANAKEETSKEEVKAKK